MAKKEKFYKVVNNARFHRSNRKQDFIFPFVANMSLRHRGCWRIKYGHLQRTHVVMHEDEMWFASRLSYHLNVHPIPREIGPWKKGNGIVRHSCGHAWCINPRHLYLDYKRTTEDFQALQMEKKKRRLEKYPWKTEEWCEERNKRLKNDRYKRPPNRRTKIEMRLALQKEYLSRKGKNK